MAELLATWLNEEVGLSRKITNFEEDFASGYLFGELLYKFNQQSDFHMFSTKNATSHFVMNFEKLEPTLRSLNVQFNSKTVEQIMNRERGQSLRLLYQLKMVLEKVYPPADISIVAKTGTFGDNQPAQRIAMSKPKYDDVSHTFFKQRLGKLNRAQKDIDLEAHQQKFDDEATRQATQAAKLDNQDVIKNAERKQEMRRIQINKLQRNAGFMEEWLAKGVEDWKQNMSIKREREAAQLEFDFTQAEKFNAITQQKLSEAQEEVHGGIDAFERNLRAQGISTKVTKDDAEKAVMETLNGKTWQPNQSTSSPQRQVDFTRTFDVKASTKKGNFTLTSTGLKHRTKKTVTDNQRKEREKRRRRLINFQGELYTNLECETRQEHVTDLMKRQSRQEKELDYEAWRTTQCKNIIIENRKLRETQYEKRREYDIELGIEKERRLISEMQEASNREMQQSMQRTAELKDYEKQAKKKNRTELCSQLMDKIFDIADEAYNHMQDLDGKSQDSRNWNEWVKLFVYKQNVAGTMSELLNSDDTACETEAQLQLDESELNDYIKNEGQWPATIVSANPINLAEVLNPKVEAAAPAKGKAPAKGPAATEVQIDEADLEVADTAQNNFIFGDVIDQLIKLHYPSRPDLKHPPTPNWLALKLSIVGYPFSGKKTQAAKIKEKYGLDVFIMEDLVNEAMEFDPEVKRMNSPAQPIEDLGSYDYEGLSEDEVLDHNVNEEFAAIGREIKEALCNGEEISDQLYVRLFITKLRCTYQYKCPVTKRREVEVKAARFVEINKRIGEIELEIKKEDIPKKLKKSLADEESALNQELADMEKLPTNGWVLVDFPCSYAQAKLLEEALSGYRPQEELEPTDREKETKDALLLVQPSPESDMAKTLIPSGLDAVIWLDCPARECLRRSDGRRWDSADPSMRYHVFDMLPPDDQAPLCERLLPLSEDNNSVQGLPDRFVAFDQNTNSMQRWMKQFGDEEHSRNLLRIFTADQSTGDLSAQIQEKLDLILEHRLEKYLNLRDTLASKIQATMENIQKQMETDALKENSTFSSGSNPRLSPSLSASKSQSQKKELGQKRGSDQLQAAQSPQQLAEGSQEKSISPRAPQFTRDNIELEFRPVLIKLWQDLSRNYRVQMKKIFRNIRRNRETSFKTGADVQKKFLEYLHRSDSKQELLDQFVKDFNKFSDEFPDLREDDATKEELHQRCDVLSDELWEIVEERKEQNVDERKKIMESGAVENNLDFLTTCAQQLFQAELDKFKTSIQIIHDYYFAIEEKTTHELTGAITSELTFEGEEMPAVEVLAEGADATLSASYSYPRLEKLLQMALKQQVVPDVTQVQNAGGADKGKGKAPPAKKGAPAAKDEPEAPVEESQYVKEMREAVKVEKSLLRFRLVQIRNWTINRLQDTRQQALNTYKKFEDWIQVAQKTEMDTIDEMCAIIKKAIEEEAKIQHELRIQFMDFTVDNSTLNYINPPIPKLEALEEVRADRFAIPQLKCLLDEFQGIAASTGDLLQCREMAVLLLNKIRNSSQFGGWDSAVPESWNNFGLAEINQMLRNIDTKSTGYVNYRTLMTYIILLKSEVPSAKEISRIEKLFKDNQVDCDTFANASFWFDQSEQSVDRENAIVFERVKIIKQLLWQTHAVDNKLNMTLLATTLGQISQRASAEATFSDVLFAQVRI